MERVINDLLLRGRLNNQIFIGSLLESVSKKYCRIRNWIEQKGNIPATHKFQWDGASGELISCNGTIVGISFKVDDEGFPDLFLQEANGSMVRFNRDSDLMSLVYFLNTEGIPWSIDPANTGQKSLGLLINNTTVMYSFEQEYCGFYQISAFDLTLYNNFIAQS